MIKFKTLLLISLIFQTSCSSSTSTTVAVIEPTIHIDQIKSQKYQDHDGIDDYNDFVNAARAQIGVVTKYDTSYYADAFPPSDRGACTDVIWRALNETGYDFKKILDEDMQKHPGDYPTKFDQNINVRRVQNIQTYLEKYAQKLPNEVIPGNKQNLQEWQGGDIVTFAQIPGGLWHIAVVSTKRRPDGVPLLIHNYGLGVKEDDYLLNWPTSISGHYRLNN